MKICSAGAKAEGRYTGGEVNSVVKQKEKVNIRFAFCFPDLYEVGMSHLGMKILYGLYNREPDIWCERCFYAGHRHGAAMRENGIKLFGIEMPSRLTGLIL